MLKSENLIKHNQIRPCLCAVGISSAKNDNIAGSARHSMQTKNAFARQRLLGWYNAIQIWLCSFQMQVVVLHHTALFQVHVVASFWISVPCPCCQSNGDLTARLKL